MDGENAEKNTADPKRPSISPPSITDGDDQSHGTTDGGQPPKKSSPWQTFLRWLKRFNEPITVVTLLLFVATAGLWIATKDLVHDAQMSGRAWVGPLDATLESAIQENELVRITIKFGNSGKEPAFTNTMIGPRIYSAEEWSSGAAAVDIIKSQELCMKVDTIDKHAARITFPIAPPAFYELGYDAASADIKDADKIKTTKGVVDKKDVIAMKGCFVYQTVASIHHTSFCYFYQHGFTQPQHLMFCNDGQDAD